MVPILSTIPPTKRVKADSNCIPGEIETRGKNKNKKGKRDMHTNKKEKKFSVFPKRNTIFCCNVLVNKLYWLSSKITGLQELSNGCTGSTFCSIPNLCLSKTTNLFQKSVQ